MNWVRNFIQYTDFCGNHQRGKVTLAKTWHRLNRNLDSLMENMLIKVSSQVPKYISIVGSS